MRFRLKVLDFKSRFGVYIGLPQLLEQLKLKGQRFKGGSMVPSFSSPTRVYVFSEATKRRYKVVGWMFIAIGLVAASFLAGTVLINANGRSSIFTLVLVLGIAALPTLEGVIFLRGVSRVSVILSADSIEARTLLVSRTLRLSDIAGKRKVLGRNGLTTYLVPAPNRHQRRIAIPDDLYFDEAFEKWLASLPDLGGFAREDSRTAPGLNWRQQER
jgi:MFS family permease